MMTIQLQLTWLFILPIPIACISWTITHEEIFKEFKEYCENICHTSKGFKRKFFYLFTCEYCFSHYITLLFLFLTHYKLLMDDWIGYLIAGFSLVWIANIYMSIFAFLRQDLKKVKKEIEVIDKQQ